MNKSTIPILLVTGVSGAGMSSALKILEDIGYDIIENLPFRLFGDLLKDKEFMEKPLAIGVDTRNRDFNVNEILFQFEHLADNQKLAPQILFLECDDDRLIDRFKVNRRKHPLTADASIREAIHEDRKSLVCLKEKADLVVDTTYLSVKELKNIITGHYGLEAEGMMISLLSFSFRRGIPREADMVFDVRFLNNPYYDKELRQLDGRDQDVQDFIQKDPDFITFMSNLEIMLSHLIHRFEIEGKSYLTVAIGCTGGRHRSVFVTEELMKWVNNQGKKALHSHRDVHIK